MKIEPGFPMPKVFKVEDLKGILEPPLVTDWEKFHKTFVDIYRPAA